LELDGSGGFATSDQGSGQVFAADYAEPTPSELTTAVNNFEAAYTDAAGRVSDFNELNGGAIGGLVLPPGVYNWSTDVSISDDIFLAGDSDDTWIFQIDGNLTTASGTNVILTGDVQIENIVWQVAGGAGVEIGTDAQFAGVVLTQTGINVLTNATVNGCLYAQTDVNLQMATVTGCDFDAVDWSSNNVVRSIEKRSNEQGSSYLQLENIFYEINSHHDLRIFIKCVQQCEITFQGVLFLIGLFYSKHEVEFRNQSIINLLSSSSFEIRGSPYLQ
jgi:hypothetical protein